jgi:signal transduction histidine kinase/ActR/RegA family two-component response regulator
LQKLSLIFNAIRPRLVLLVLAVAGPAALTTALLVNDAYRQQREITHRQLLETTRALSLVVDRQIGQAQTLLEALATSPYLDEGNLAAFDHQARAAIRNGGMRVVLLDMDYRQLVNTVVPFGSGLPVVPPTETGVRWTSMVDSRVKLSNLVMGRLPAQPIFMLTLPVVKDGELRYRLSVVIQADTLNLILQEQRLPPSWIGTIIDQDGIVVARTRDAGRYVGHPATADLRELISNMREGTGETVSLDGTHVIAAFSRSPSYPWTFAIGMPLQDFVQSARQPLLWAAAMGVGLLSFGVMMAMWVARVIARSVDTVADAAERLRRGVPVGAIATGLVEADRVGFALRRTGATLLRREKALQELNATLESRVGERTAELAAANERLRAEIAERAQAEEQLRQAQKMEAVGRLTGGIAHDFNNLLTGVLGNLELLRRRLVGSDNLRYADRAISAAERGARLTKQLLAFSRRQHLQPRPLDVNALVDGMIGLLGSTLGGKMRIERRLGRDAWLAMADPTQLEMIVLNLSINARDALPSGGTVVIETANVTVTTQAREEDPAPGDYLMLRVSDNGIGMAPDVLARAFDPFFTTKPAGEGSGLGLSQVLGISKQMGGGVRIESTPGRGTAVEVYLPRTKPEQKPVRDEVAEEAKTPEPLTGLSVLLVDDDDEVREVVADMLAQMSADVVIADTGQEALKRLAAGTPVDVAVIDFAMPGLDGAATAEQARRLRANLPVVLVTGYADVTLVPDCYTGPLLRKPFTATELSEAILSIVPHAVDPDRIPALGD